MAQPAPSNACRNPQDNRGGGGVLPNASSQHSGVWGWFEGAYSRTVSTAEAAYHDVAGAVDYGYHATTHAIETGYTVVTDEMRSWINSIPDHIAHAASWDQLRYWAEIALGGQSFNVGVGVGMVKNLADGVLGLLKMLKTFILAGLYEQAHASSQGAAAAVNPQTYLIAKAADLVLGKEMKQADEEARAMLKELKHLLTNPGELLTALGQQYKQKWDRFWELSKDTSLSSRFEAGEIVGDILMDIIMLVQLAEGAVKLATKIPKLLAEAEKLATKVPEIARAARGLGAVKKAESLEDLAKAGREIKDPVRTVRPQTGSSNGVPSVAEETPKIPEKPLKSKPKLQAGSPEHKAARWQKYKAKGGKWDYERWSKQYETNMQNAARGLAREGQYREQLGGVSKTLKTPFTNRQIDIFRQADDYMGQLKTGPVTLTPEDILAIKKDEYFVKEGYKVEYILEKGASQPYLDALTKAGIKPTMTPKIP